MAPGSTASTAIAESDGSAAMRFDSSRLCVCICKILFNKGDKRDRVGNEV